MITKKQVNAINSYFNKKGMDRKQLEEVLNFDKLTMESQYVHDILCMLQADKDIEPLVEDEEDENVIKNYVRFVKNRSGSGDITWDEFITRLKDLYLEESPFGIRVQRFCKNAYWEIFFNHFDIEKCDDNEKITFNHFWYHDTETDNACSTLGKHDIDRAQGEYTSNGDGHGSYDDYYDDDKDYTWHDGIENGTVGKGSKSRLAFLKHIATEDLDPNERYVKVLEGEAIFTDGQQENLINNFQNASIPYFVPVIKPQTLPNNINKQGYINVEFNGDLNLPDVRDVDGFARALKDQFPNILRQQLSKRN